MCGINIILSDIPELLDVCVATLAIQRLINHEPLTSVFVWLRDCMNDLACLFCLAALGWFVSRRAAYFISILVHFLVFVYDILFIHHGLPKGYH